MIGLIQRVAHASVTVDDQVHGQIGEGLLLFLGVEMDDTLAKADRLLEKVLGYRIFPDAQGRMNRSLAVTGGGLLIVSQFTLVADTSRGLRPGFSRGAPPDLGRTLYEYFVGEARKRHQPVGSGVYGADMRVTLCNAGPATFWLTVR